MEIHEARPLPPSQSVQSPRRTSNLQALPPLITSPVARSSRSPNISRPLSTASKRESRSSHLAALSIRSRPQSNVFSTFHSNLPYTLVRDFAYPADSPMHYGTHPDPPSVESTPLSAQAKGLSDQHDYDWRLDQGVSATPSHKVSHLPQTAYDNDGPPWSEDEDLHSPIVTSARHKKSKSTLSGRDSSREASYKGRSLSHDDTAGYLDDWAEGETEGEAEGPGRMEFPDPRYDWRDGDRDNLDESPMSPEFMDEEESRYSKDYQFTIASPDEEMHGKAVALYDFARENENELPLVEGQVLWVSYRHGQGWLVAQDPKSGESGLVPEEYVRLVRDIEGGLSGLNGAQVADGMSPTVDIDTPTASMQAEHKRSGSGTSGHHYTPVVSHFSTSSRDLQRYPQHLLGSQTTTPILGSDAHFGRKGSEDIREMATSEEQERQ